MQEIKVTLIYFGLSLFALLALAPWILNFQIGMMAIKALVIYGGIVISFLRGFI